MYCLVKFEKGSLVAVSMEAAGGGARARGHWRPEEDETLRQLVEQHGPQNWDFIAEKHGRSGKSCRFRWINHLDPTLNRSEEEEERLLNAHCVHGNEWALERCRLCGKRRSHKFISSSTGDITISNLLEAADTSGRRKEMGRFLTLGTTMNELSSYGESSAGPQNFGVINSDVEEPEDTDAMHKNVEFIDFLGVGI
ncbi:Transcription factor [Nymphaea thermarum]|nr:Transcription factor [Nymphaea thermarum]